MAPSIRVGDEKYQALKQHAEPFVDTPETVIRRLLAETGLAEMLFEHDRAGRGDGRRHHGPPATKP